MSESDVLVLGAGPAGLATSQQLERRGIAHRVLERGDQVGHSWAHLYHSLRLHTGKRMSSLPGLPFPRSYPVFIPRHAFWEYLRDYADRFALPVETGSPVSGVRFDHGRWVVTVHGGRGGVEGGGGRSFTARALVVATGNIANPQVPPFVGRERFRGRIAHSIEYRQPEPYVGRRVLVVGVGNSGAEIGSELARAGARVTIAVRSGANVVPLTLFGVPIQYVSYWVRKLPRPLQELLVAAVGKVTELRRGPPVLPRPAHSPLEAIPVIGFHLVDAIRAGLVTVAPGVAEFTETGATFTDGSHAAFDDVILATGFAPALAPFGDLIRKDARGFALRHGRVASADHPGLYFVGHNYDATGGLHNINRDARAVARLVAAG